jgi:O-antigen/teichoic acid export membrane protein
MLAQIVGNAGFFVAVTILARGLDPSGRGTIAFITVAGMVVARLASFGIPQATIVFAAQPDRLRPAVLSTGLAFTLATATGLAAVVALALSVAGAPVSGIGSPELVLFCVGTVALALLEVVYAFFLGIGRFRLRAGLITVVPWCYALAVAGDSLVGGISPRSAVADWAAAHLVGSAVVVSIALGVGGRSRPQLALLRESFSFGMRAWTGSLSLFLNFRLDQIMMGFLATDAALGIYAVAVNGGEVILYLPAAIATAATTAIARTAPELRTARTLGVVRGVLLISIPSVVFGALVGAPLLPVVFGSQYEDAVTPFLLLLPGALGFAALVVFSNALLAESAPGASSAGALVSLVVGVTLDVVLIPRFGAEGAAAAASAAFLAGGVAATVIYRLRSPFSWTELVPGRSDLETVRATGGAMLRYVGAR